MLAICVVLSMMAPAANAVTAGGEGYQAALNNAAHSADASGDALVVSGEDTAKIPTLRDEDAQEAVKQNGKDTNGNYGGWVAESVEGVSADLMDPEVPSSINELRELANTYSEDEVVSAFVVMEAEPLVSTYSNVLKVPAAKEELLLQQQNEVVMMIEEDVLGGEKLEVSAQFTYLANTIVVETEFGNLEQIAVLPGVKSVFVSPVYYPSAADSTVKVAKPFTVSAGEMSGVPTVWQDLGLTGSGMKIAIIDTGLDMDHPSFAAAPADPSMTVADIEAVMDKLNAVKFNPSLTAEDLYNTEKVPFTFNYYDGTTDVNHYPTVGDHGTHVAGIAAANALEGTGVVGMAPDAQVVVMQVFTEQGGAQLEEIIAAVEDAMILGCDVANLSLGSSAGFTKSSYDFVNTVYESLENSDIIVNISAGNDGTSAYQNMWGTDLNTTTNPDNAAVGSPSTYVNVNSIASVDNAMMNSGAIHAAGEDFAYSEAIGLYVTFDTLAELGDIEYVMVPGLGEDADFEGLDVEGKIAVIARGSLNFSLKLYNAEVRGAIGVIITNNEPGSVSGFGMNMEDDYGNLNDGISGMIPCVLVSQSAGEVLAAQETKTLTVYAEPIAVTDEGGGQMSSFSSWGVAPDLGLAPDMAGVGGNVYSSVDNGGYDYMSGTSMSCPQVSGMSALVVEYLKEKVGITNEKTLREMANGLLMSTAEVIVDFDTQLEASPRQQGAGLVNALNALTSEAYLTVANEENNNKPKAELLDGDGTYSFTFTVHNFGDTAKTYTLSSSLLTEAVNADYYEYYGEYFMAGYETELDGTVSFSADTVTVPAGGTADVTVTVTVSAAGKAWLEQYYPNGGYVEGFVYLTNADADGVDLSLPFMGFCGDWTDAPVFDTAYWYDNSFWSEEPVDGIPEGNEFWHALWTDLGGVEYVLGMNPYSGAILDENGKVNYDPANNVISNNGDGVLDTITEIYISLMRNADHLTFTYTDATTGEELFWLDCEEANKTMYLANYGQVVPFVHTWWRDPWNFTTEDGEALPSGTKILLTVSGSLEYGEETEVHETLQFPITLDTNAPTLVGEIIQTQEDGRNLVTFTVADESSLAAVFLLNPTGTQTLDVAYDPARNEDGTWTVTLDVTGYGKNLMLALCDYGANEGYYELVYDEYANAPKVDTDALYAYRVYDAAIYDDSLFGWVSIDKETAEVTQLTNDMYEYYALTAAEYVDGYIFAVDAGNNLVIIEPGTFFRKTVCNLGVAVLDMTFNKADNTMYLSTKQSVSDYEDIYTISKLDLLTGDMEVLTEAYDAYSLPYAMAAADSGEIYAVKNYDSSLYKVNQESWYLEEVVDAEGSPVTLLTAEGKYAAPYYSQSMTYSSADNCIYWAYFTYTSDAELFTIDVSGEVPTCSSVEFPVDAECVGVLTLDEDEDYTLPQGEEISKLVLSQETLILPEGDSAALTVGVMPWNYTPAEDVVWASDDESVATVDQNGNVTAVSEGYALISATCEGVTAECFVEVVHIGGTVYFYDYYNGNGTYGSWQSLDLNSMEQTELYASPVDFNSADYNGHDGNIYGYDMNGQCYRFNPETGDCAALGTPVKGMITDLAYDYSTGYMYAMVVDQNAWTSTLCYVNMNTGALVEVATTYDVYMTLACDGYGTLFAINAEGNLFCLFVMPDEYGGGGIMPWSAETMAETGMMIDAMPVMENLIGTPLNYLQSMCYDHANDVLVWTNPETSCVYWVDPYGGYVLNLGDPSNSGLIEYLGMYTVPAEIPELAYVGVESVTAQDMLLLSGGEKLPNVTVEPLNATNQQIEWSGSSDESVAYMNENGCVVAVSEGQATITGTLTDGENVFDLSFTVTVKESAGEIYGYIATDIATGGGQVWTVFSDTDPTNLIDYPAYTDYMIFAQEYLDGKLYAFGYDTMDWEANWQYMVVDAQTYEIESMTDMGEGFPFVYDMTFDYSTGTMYAVAGYNDNSSDLYMVDMNNGRLIQVMQTEPFFMSLAADAEGNLYGIAASEVYEDPWTWEVVAENAMLYKFDVAAGTYELFMDTGIKCNKLASMAFDFDTGNLYWSAMYQASYWDPMESGLYLLDLENQASFSLGLIGPAGSQLTGMYIIADEYPEIPNVLYNASMSSAMEVLAPGETVELTYFLQPAGAEVTTVWTSADENVATVDENGLVTAVAPGVTTITLTVSDGTTTLETTCTIVVYGMDDYFLSYNRDTKGWYKIDRINPAQVYVTTEGEELADVRSAVITDGDKIYGYDTDNRFFVTSEEDGFVRTYLGEGGLEVMGEDTDTEHYYYEVRDLAYNAADGKLYAVVCHSVESQGVDWWGDAYTENYELTGGCGLYEADMTTGALTYVTGFVTIYGEDVSNVYTLAFDGEGTPYIYSSFDDYVSTVNMETGVISQITTLQNQGVYGDSEGAPMAMEYDAVTNAVYMLFTTNGNVYQIYKFDMADKSMTSLGFVGDVFYNEDTWEYENAEKYASLMIHTGHYCTWSEWVVTTEPSCTEEGVETRACVGCGATEERPVDKVPHAYDSVVVAPTCTEDGYTVHTCSGCGDSYKDTFVSALGHSLGEWVVVEEATDKTNGYMQTVCGECHEKFTVNLYAVLENNGEKFVINSGDDVLVLVSLDGEILPEDAYVVEDDGMTVTLTPEFLATLEAGEYTLTVVYEEGLAEGTFTVPEGQKEPGTNSDTGDSFSAAWIAALLVSLAGAAALLASRKKFFVK